MRRLVSVGLAIVAAATGRGGVPVAGSGPDGAIVFAAVAPPRAAILSRRFDGRGSVALGELAASDIFPALSPDGEEIAFVRVVDDVSSVWLMRASGAGRRRIAGLPQAWTAAGAAVGPLSWSPDGRRVATSVRRCGVRLGQRCLPALVVVLDVRTGRLRVVGPGEEPAWSPDARRLLYVRFASDQASSATLVVCAVDCSRAREIAHGTISEPVWSPRGDLVAFGGASLVVSRPDGGRRRVLSSGDFASNPVFSPDGKSLVAVKDDKLQLFDLRRQPEPSTLAVGVSPYLPPYWSSDGRQLLYVDTTNGVSAIPSKGGSPRLIATARGPVAAFSASWRQQRMVLGYQVPVSSEAGLFSVDPEGGGLRLLGWSGSQPSVAHDGRIAVSRGCCIWIIDPSSGRQRELTAAAVLGYSQVSPSWSPGGDQIAFSNSDGLFVADADGGGSHPVVNGSIGEVRWSPVGDQIAYAFGGVHVVHEPDDGSGVRVLVADGEGVTHLAWSPDGRQLASVGSAGLEVTAADGSGARLLVAGADDPGWVAWAPSTRRLVYSTISGGSEVVNADGSREFVSDWQLWTIAADGSMPRRVASGVGQLWGLDWGP